MVTMAIDQTALQRHLDDYARAKKQTTEHFICPITFRPCAEDELVNGHILPEGLNNASGKTVIQYGKLDFFYGSRVEDTLIRYLNLSETSSEDVVRHCDELTVRFSDGAAIPAFVAEGAAA